MNPTSCWRVLDLARRVFVAMGACLFVIGCEAPEGKNDAGSLPTDVQLGADAADATVDADDHETTSDLPAGATSCAQRFDCVLSWGEVGPCQASPSAYWRYELGKEPYGDEWDDWLRLVVPADDGFLLVGTHDCEVISTSDGDDPWFVRVDGSGRVLWSRPLGVCQLFLGRMVAGTDGKSWFVAWSSMSKGTQLVRIDEAGSVLWTTDVAKASANAGDALSPGAIGFANDEVILLGETSEFHKKHVVVRFDQSGTQLSWTETGVTGSQSVGAGASGAGRLYGTVELPSGEVVYATTTKGKLLWKSKPLGGSIRELSAASTGSVAALVLVAVGPDANAWRAVVLDDAGKQTGSLPLGTLNVGSFLLDAAGALTYSVHASTSTSVVTRLRPDGTVAWSQTLDYGTDDLKVLGMAPAKGDAVAMVGSTMVKNPKTGYEGGAGWFERLDADGKILCIE